MDSTIQHSDSFIIPLGCILAAIGVGILVAGGSHKVVIFYDWKDMLNSFLAALFSYAAVLIFTSTPEKIPHGFNHWALTLLAAFIGLMCLFENFKNAVHHNRSFILGLLIGAFKLVYLIFTLFFIMSQFTKLTAKNSSSQDRIAAVIVIGISALLTKAMINGPDVYNSKGWIHRKPDASPQVIKDQET